jgi:hypothetical protein
MVNGVGRLLLLCLPTRFLLFRPCSSPEPPGPGRRIEHHPDVVVVEEHHHALPYWYDVARRKQDEGSRLLVHIDTHDDLALPRSGGFASWRDDTAPPNHFVARNDCFVLDAVVRGLIDEVVFIQFNDIEAPVRYSGKMRVDDNDDGGAAALAASLWTEGAENDSPAAVPVWCVCGDPAGLHSGIHFPSLRLDGDGDPQRVVNLFDDCDKWANCCPGGPGEEGFCTEADCQGPEGLAPCPGFFMLANCPETCDNLTNSSAFEFEYKPCFYNERQELMNLDATTPAEIARSRNWAWKSSMAPLPHGTFCNLAKGWRDGRVLEWPSAAPGKTMMGGALDGKRQGEVEAEAGGVIEATVHTFQMKRGLRGQGRIAARDIAAAIRSARGLGSAPGRFFIAPGDGGSGDGGVKEKEKEEEEEEEERTASSKGWLLDIDEDWFFPDYSPSVLLHRKAAKTAGELVVKGIATLVEKVQLALRPLEFYTAGQEYAMDKGLRAALAALVEEEEEEEEEGEKMEEPTLALRLLVEEWAEKLSAEFADWHLKTTLDELRETLRAVVFGLAKLPRTVRRSLLEIGFCKSMVEESDFEHEHPFLDPEERARTPMRLNFCVGEAGFDEEHFADFAGRLDKDLHPSRPELARRSVELRDFLREIASSWTSSALVSGLPLLTTVCRSNRDGYAPRNETAFVEGEVLDHLRELGWLQDGGGGGDDKNTTTRRTTGSDDSDGGNDLVLGDKGRVRSLHGDPRLLGLVTGRSRHDEL